MDNIDLKRNGDILTLEIDISKECGHSKSGRTVIVASSRGNIPLPGLGEYGFRLGVTLFKYVDTAEEYVSEVPKALKRKRVSRRTLDGKNKKSKAFNRKL